MPCRILSADHQCQGRVSSHFPHPHRAGQVCVLCVCCVCMCVCVSVCAQMYAPLQYFVANPQLLNDSMLCYRWAFYCGNVVGAPFVGVGTALERQLRAFRLPDNDSTAATEQEPFWKQDEVRACVCTCQCACVRAALMLVAPLLTIISIVLSSPSRPPLVPTPTESAVADATHRTAHNASVSRDGGGGAGGVEAHQALC